VANTDKQNFRCPAERWGVAQVKAAAMRAAGYDVDVTKVLNAEVVRFNDESMEETAARLGLSRSKEGPVPVWRKPFSRDAAA
jgi:hypothetical protein